MSTISAIWSRANEPLARLHLQAMLVAQAMYGSGTSFSWGELHVALGGSLANTLPEDRFDTQPLWNADRTACLVADVRLDNRDELTKALDLIHPEELADSAILMAAWQRWGESCLDHLVGGFAFAVWMPGRQQIFAARDHAGERPLFYHHSDNLFALATMPNGLLALPGVFQGFDEDRLADWFIFHPPTPGTSFFAGVNCLLPGHFLRFTPESFECKQYWHPADAKPIRYLHDEDYAEALIEIFDQATAARLRTTKPVGSFLSAGLDSSSVTATAALLLSGKGQQLTAYTAVPRSDYDLIGEPWDLVNEGPGASEVARLYPNIHHALVDSKGYDLLHILRSWTDALGEPLFNVVNGLWLTAILNQARQAGIQVLLEGVSGNLSISWQTLEILPHFFRRGRWIKLFNTAKSLRRHGDISIRSAVRITLGDILPAWCSRRLINPNRLQNFYSPVAHPELMRRRAIFAKQFEDTFGNPGVYEERIRAFDLMADGGPYNAATWAVSGIETRDPSADKRVYEFCFAIPPEQYVVGGHSRSLVRRAMKGRLPESTLNRYIRGDQGADWYLPMSEALPSLRDEVSLEQESPAARQNLDLPRMQTLLETFPDSGYETKAVSLVWNYALTRGVSMGYFLRSNESAHCAPATPPIDPASGTSGESVSATSTPTN